MIWARRVGASRALRGLRKVVVVAVVVVVAPAAATVRALPRCLVSRDAHSRSRARAPQELRLVSLDGVSGANVAVTSILLTTGARYACVCLVGWGGFLPSIEAVAEAAKGVPLFPPC